MSNKKLISAEEWEPLSFVGREAQLSFAHVHEMYQAWREQTGTEPDGYFLLTDKTLRAKNWSGVLPTRNFQLEIRPRGSKGLTEDQKAKLDWNTGLMMQAAVSGKRFTFSDAELSDKGDRYKALIASFIESVAVARTAAIIRRYSTRRATTPSIIGRNVFPAQILEGFRRPGYFVSEWVSLDEDIAENRFISGVLKYIRPQTAGPLRAKLDQQLVSFEKVSAPADPMREWAKIRFDRTPVAYTTALELGKAILLRQASGVFAGSQRGSSEIVFTARAFEAFFGKLIQDVAQRLGLKSTLQETYSLGAWLTGKEAFEVKPDIELFSSSPGPSVLIDTKWKLLRPRAENYGVKVEDVYQMLAYSGRLGHTKAILLYPWIGTVPFSSRSFQVKQGPSILDIYIVTVNLLDQDFVETENHLASVISAILSNCAAAP